MNRFVARAALFGMTTFAIACGDSSQGDSSQGGSSGAGGGGASGGGTTGTWTRATGAVVFRMAVDDNGNLFVNAKGTPADLDTSTPSSGEGPGYTAKLAAADGKVLWHMPMSLALIAVASDGRLGYMATPDSTVVGAVSGDGVGLFETPTTPSVGLAFDSQGTLWAESVRFDLAGTPTNHSLVTGVAGSIAFDVRDYLAVFRRAPGTSEGAIEGVELSGVARWAQPVTVVGCDLPCGQSGKVLLGADGTAYVSFGAFDIGGQVSAPDATFDFGCGPVGPAGIAALDGATGACLWTLSRTGEIPFAYDLATFTYAPEGVAYLTAQALVIAASADGKTVMTFPSTGISIAAGSAESSALYVRRNAGTTGLFRLR